MTEKNMKISVDNYGPIAEAKDIELCPLTVFVGPSNTGKSYLAILIYSLLKSFQDKSGLVPPFNGKPRRQERILFDLTGGEREVSSIEKLLNGDIKNIKLSNLPEGLQKWSNKKIAKSLNRQFRQELFRCLSISSKEDHWISNNFKLNLKDNHEKLTLKSSDETLSLKIKEMDTDENSFAISQRYLLPMIRELEIPQEIKAKLQAELFLMWISRNIFRSLRKANSFYLPEARIGIMQTNRAIGLALVRLTSLAENIPIPTLSGIVSDFIHELDSRDSDKILDPKVGKVAEEIEKDTLHGSIKLKFPKGNQPPQILYTQNGLEVPLLRSSSMVAGLASVVLFIRHIVKRGDLLIIEEPEAHLHPEAQRNIAKAVVSLVRTGVRVIVTTHSDYFLEQLANYVRLSKLSKSKRDKLIDHQNLFLKENEIGAYAFDRQKGGTIVKRLHFDQENGLSPEDHDKVSSDLYNETVELLDQLDQQGYKG